MGAKRLLDKDLWVQLKQIFINLNGFQLEVGFSLFEFVHLICRFHEASACSSLLGLPAVWSLQYFLLTTVKSVYRRSRKLIKGNRFGGSNVASCLRDRLYSYLWPTWCFFRLVWHSSCTIWCHRVLALLDTMPINSTARSLRWIQLLRLVCRG